MKNHGKKEEIIFVIVKKDVIYFIFQEPFKVFHKNMKNSNKWLNVVMLIYF
jgi:hypothetical protein